MPCFFILNVQHCNNQLNFVYISLSTRRSRKEEILKMVILLLQQPATSTYILHEFFVRPVAISTFEIILFIFCYQQFHFLILFQALAKVHDFFFFFLLTFFSISHDKFGIFAKNGNFLCCFYFASLNNKRKTNEREKKKELRVVCSQGVSKCQNNLVTMISIIFPLLLDYMLNIIFFRWFT